MASQEPIPAQTEPSITNPPSDIPPPSTDTQAPSDTAPEVDKSSMSKNALKRLAKQQRWEEAKTTRRLKRKEKRQERKLRNRTTREALIAQGADPSSFASPKRPPSTQVPVTLLLDCDFESYMTDKERISLSSQVTRAYSDNRNALYRSHVWVAGFQGRLRDRFDQTLEGQYKNWKGMHFYEGNFLECAAQGRELGSQGEVIPPLAKSLEMKVPWTRDEVDPFPLEGEQPELDERYKDVVYLSSDSPYTLERLEPNTTYVIGGLVDKNREKGLCYRRAVERGIRTARLPIGQFMVMASRQVLATNHVVLIMLKWLEFEDWGRAFVEVIPKRKGGKLIGDAEEEEDDESKLEEPTEEQESKPDADTPPEAEAQEQSKPDTEAQPHSETQPHSEEPSVQ